MGFENVWVFASGWDSPDKIYRNKDAKSFSGTTWLTSDIYSWDEDRSNVDGLVTNFQSISLNPFTYFYPPPKPQPKYDFENYWKTLSHLNCKLIWISPTDAKHLCHLLFDDDEFFEGNSTNIGGCYTGFPEFRQDLFNFSRERCSDKRMVYFASW